MPSASTSQTREMAPGGAAEPYVSRRFHAIYSPEPMAMNLAAFLIQRGVKVRAEKTPVPNVAFLALPKDADLDAAEALVREWKASAGRQCVPTARSR